MEIGDIYIYMYVCMYSFFYGTFTRASTNYLDTARRIAHFMRAREALTNAMDGSIAHTVEEKDKSKRKREWEREARQNESEIR